MDIGHDGSDVESGSESYVSSQLGGEIRIGDEYQASIPNAQACKFDYTCTPICSPTWPLLQSMTLMSCQFGWPTPASSGPLRSAA